MKDIYAVQLIKGEKKGSQHSYDIYEINLILKKNGRKLNVLIHGNKKNN